MNDYDTPHLLDAERRCNNCRLFKAPAKSGGMERAWFFSARSIRKNNASPGLPSRADHPLVTFLSSIAPG
ncbi:hypothetical protein [Nitrosomonas communis]|uniref:hypothetical protein n=1 Tax=Nitrosomonas communis TaxID=44574 RepID=UPI003D2875F9